MVSSDAVANIGRRLPEMQGAKRAASPEDAKWKSGGSIRNLEVGLDFGVFGF
jgi:hypothetical protein